MARRHQLVSHYSVPPAWKFEAPALPEQLLPRQHLSAKVEQYVGKAKSTGDVFLVTAPAGYGKTTLLAQWAARTSVRVAWYHLDASDNDPAVLLAGIVRALHRCLPRAEWQVAHILQRLRDVVSPQDLTRAMNLLTQDIRNQVARPLALVMTGLSALNPKGEGHAILDRLLLRPPDHLRLVLETVEAPKLRVSPLVMQRRLHGIGAEELRLRDSELAELLDTIGVTLDEEQEQRLRSLCEGWITGILLATGALTPSFLSSHSPGASGDLDREAIFDYLSCRVIDALPPVLRGFAIQSAILDYMTPSLCAQLLDLPDAQEARTRLVALEKRTGFVTRSGRRPGEPIYRFQALLRQALLERLESESEPDGPTQRLALHLRAGELLEERVDDEEAVRQYAQAQAPERIVALIESRRGSLLRAGRGATLARWLALLSEDARSQRPHLQILLAEMHRLAGRTAEALTAAQQACNACLPRTGRDPTLAAKALLCRGQVRFIQGHYKQAQDDAEEALRLAPPDADDLHVAVGFLRVGCFAVLGHLDAADNCLDEIERRASRMRDLWALARLHYHRSKLLIEKNAYADAEMPARTALLYAQEADNEVDAVNIRLNLGAIRLRTGRLAEAREEFEVARAHAEEAGLRRSEAYALAHLGDLELYQGDIAKAHSTYKLAIHIAESVEDAYVRAWAYKGLGYSLALQGASEHVALLLTPVMAEYQGEALAVEQGMLAHALGFSEMCAEHFVAAESLLSQACAHFEGRGVPFEQACSLFCLAETMLRQARNQDARTSLWCALEAAAQANALSPLALEVRHLVRVSSALRELQHPLAAALAEEQSAELTRASNGNSVNSDSAFGAIVAEQMYPLRAYALGSPRVLRGEELARWRLPAARELLFYLLEHGGSARRDEIVADLWPEKDAEAANNAFRAARFHLKEALGRPCLVQQDNCWTLSVDCWVDVREFEQAIDEGELLAEGGEITNAASALRRALTYWTGPYLVDVYDDWTATRREQLQERYLACLERLAELETRLGHLEQAAQLYYEILDTVPHRESAYRGLMNYFVLRDEPAEAIKQFQRCVNVLHDEMGITPGPKTLALYQAIIGRLDSSTRQFIQAARRTRNNGWREQASSE
jgi:LuxR family maltose regulon positive regulatory protein